MALGVWDVENLLDAMPWPQFQQWQRYALIEPFGEERADLRMGIVASTIVNINRDPRKGEPAKPEDFMPRFVMPEKAVPPKREPMRQAAWEKLKSMARAFAGAKG